MAMASLIHARCGYYTPRISCRKNVSQQGPLGSSPNGNGSSSSLQYSSSSSSSNSDLNFPSGANSGLRHQGIRAQSMSSTTQGMSLDRSIGNSKNDPDHLLILVHGILASPSDWIYAEAELKRRLGKNFLIYVSSSNTFAKTFTGIDRAGKRLADEVMQVVAKTKSLKRISFLAHSLGGLFARYAIAVLYSPDDLENCNMESSERKSCSRRGLIAGLEPINFITLATPHLGVRGKKQVYLGR